MSNKERYAGENITSPQNEIVPGLNIINDLEEISLEVRRGVFETILNAGSGHLGACSSSTELMVALYFGGILNYDKDNPRHQERDRVLVRGHIGPLRYKIFSLLGWIQEGELNGYRELNSRLQGHETMDQVPGVDITPSGSLGMVLSYGVGAAIAAKTQNREYKTYVFLGDGEEQEGNVSEAARHATHLKLDNLICILDKNGGQLGRRTNTVDGVTDIAQVWTGYGWDVAQITDGNNISEVYNRLKELILQERNRPLIIIANTTKGKGIPGAEDNCCGYHTISSCRRDDLLAAIGVLKSELEKRQCSPADVKQKVEKYTFDRRLVAADDNEIDFKVAIEPPRGEKNIVEGLVYYLNQLNKHLKESISPRLYALTADLIRKDQIEMCGFSSPVIYIDVGIREQHLLALAHGISQSDNRSRIIINYGDAFLYRGSDQLNVIAQGRSPLIIVGDDGGLSGGRNGSTHQSSGQPGVLCTMPGIRFYEPADVRDLFNCLNKSFNQYIEPVYIRLHTRDTDEIERGSQNLDNTTYYEVNKTTDEADCVIVSSGLTTRGAAEAKKILSGKYNIRARVINIVDLKSVDDNFSYLIENGRPVLTVYNGNELILRSVISAAVLSSGKNLPSLIKGHGFDIGTSGRLEDLIKYFRFDGEGIIKVLRLNFPKLFEKTDQTRHYT